MLHMILIAVALHKPHLILSCLALLCLASLCLTLPCLSYHVLCCRVCLSCAWPSSYGGRSVSPPASRRAVWKNTADEDIAYRWHTERAKCSAVLYCTVMYCDVMRCAVPCRAMLHCAAICDAWCGFMKTNKWHLSRPSSMIQWCRPTFSILYILFILSSMLQ